MTESRKPTTASILKINSVEQIRLAMSHVFQDAQLSLSGHRKLVIVLKNIYNKAIDLDFVDHFSLYFSKLINKILPLKRGELVADRIAKFCSAFVASISKDDVEVKDEEIEKEEDDDDQIEKDESDSEEESHTSSFIKFLIHHLLRGIEAKDKNVRYRVVQILAYLVFYIGEIENLTFEALYTSLSKRLFDKESTVRIQAVVALSRFQAFNYDFDEDSNPFNIPLSKELITNKMVSTIKYDDSAEVRRAVLLNLNKNEQTIPQLVGRVRDNNTINRRLVFSRICRELDFKSLNPQLREYLLKWGLNDREESVKLAAVKMLNKYWFEAVHEDILELIDQLRVTESGVADLAMSVFFKGREDKLSLIKIDEVYWKALTVEKAFLMRTFYYHCNQNNLYELIEKNFPESIELADTLDKYLKLRAKFLLTNEAIVKKHDFHNKRMEDIKSLMFSVENLMAKIKYEVEALKKSMNDSRKVLEDYPIIQELVKKRISRLKKLDETYDDLVTDANEYIMEQIVELDQDELKIKLKDLRESTTESKAEVKELTVRIRDCELEFQEANKKYEELSKEKIEEETNFSKNDDEVLPFLDESKDLEFIIEQLLLVAKEFDFSDEIGRRKMLQTIRISLTEDDLSPSLITIGLQILRKISINERDFITMATEVITDIRDSYDNEDETFHSAHSGFEDDDDEDEDEDDTQDTRTTLSKKRKLEPKLPPDDTVIRCLITTQYVLELIEEPLENYVSLGSIYSGLVNYAIHRNENYTVHLQGLKCLGLFALIDRKTAEDSVVTFFASMRNAGEEVRIIGMKAIVDILSTYGISIMESRILYQYGKLFYKSLNMFDMPKLQCIVAEGLCKLFLADVFNDTSPDTEDEDSLQFETEKQLFEALILIYFHPLTIKNQELRQILAFCIPVYSFSHPNHQFRLASISGDVIYRMFDDSNEFSKFESKLSPTTIVQQLIYWCDPNNLVNIKPELLKAQTAHIWQSVYYLQVVEQDTPKLVKKAIINNLNKFYYTDSMNTQVLKGLIDGIAVTKECFERSTTSEFNFDKLTTKNFEAFEIHIKEIYENALKRENDEQVHSHSSTRSNSVTPGTPGTHETSLILDEKEPSVVKIEINPEEILAETSELHVEVEDKMEVEDKIEVEPDSKQNEIDAELQNIDQMLEEEEEVDYDISMAGE